MVLRKALFWWQFIAVVVLPTAMLIARGILGSSQGWDFVLYLVISPILGAFMLLVAGLTAARSSVRADRALGWLDTGTLLAWHASIVAFAILDVTPLAAVVVVFAVAAFWVAVWQLVTETGRRVRTAVRDFGDEFAGVRDEMRAKSPSVQVGDVIVIQPSDDATPSH